jgi:hypothetical protein
MFAKKINPDYLKLSKIVYGGEFYYELDDYFIKDIPLLNDKFEKVFDSLLSKDGHSEFFSYKNENTGFVANLFQHKKSNNLIIAFRGTERLGMGENVANLNVFLKDVFTDMNLVSSNTDEQFFDAWQFYKNVKAHFPNQKIVIVGQSLGGALAQIVAAKEFTVNRKKIETYTYNAPGCKHLLDIYDCNLSYKYSFIHNYSVMNDWCGMFGEHIGSRYLILPIAINEVDVDSKIDVLNNIFLTTHEGIFNYTEKTMGKVFCKPKDFNQLEGLSLWYFDKNNPLQDYKNLSEFLNISIPKFNFPDIDFKNNSFVQSTEKFFKENLPEDVQNSNIAIAIKNGMDNFLEIQNQNKDKFIDGVNNNTINVAMRIFDESFAQLSPETLDKANRILSRLNSRKRFF